VLNTALACFQPDFIITCVYARKKTTLAGMVHCRGGDAGGADSAVLSFYAAL